MPLRVSPEEEKRGLDFVAHGGKVYDQWLIDLLHL